MATFEILDTAGAVENTIVAELDFVDSVFPGRYREVELPASYDFPAMIAARRFEEETGGITVDGVEMDTTRDSQALLTGAALSAMRDAGYSLNWKTPSGFVRLDAEQVLVIADTVRAHVQACFDREAELLAALADGSFTPSMLDEGWPA